MKELKFRVWDGEKIRYDVTGFEHGFKNEMEGVFLDGDIFKIKNNPVMQYTEIKDEDGKEMYEGDIIEDTKHGRKMRTFIVDDIRTISAEFSNSEHSSEWRVIGNIHENPELNKETK